MGRHVLRGDVDGDGVSDSVFLVRLRRENARCGAVLVVRTGSRTLTRAFPTIADPRFPTLNGLAALTSRPALQIVVTTWEGASTAFAGVFRVQGRRILQLEIPGNLENNAFAYEGSVTHFDAIDCVRGAAGQIIASGWFERGASGRDFGFVRRFYRVGPTRFELVRTLSGPTRSPLPVRSRFREFREPQPFPSCMRARGAAA